MDVKTAFVKCWEFLIPIHALNALIRRCSSMLILAQGHIPHAVFPDSINACLLTTWFLACWAHAASCFCACTDLQVKVLTVTLTADWCAGDAVKSPQDV